MMGEYFQRSHTEECPMNATTLVGPDCETSVADFAAELTEAVYPVVLRHGAVDNWLDLELDLWRTLKKTVGRCEE
jgi:hypothetical protein